MLLLLNFCNYVLCRVSHAALFAYAKVVLKKINLFRSSQTIAHK